MKEYLLEKLNETKKKIQQVTIEKINLGVSMALYKKLENARIEYNYNVKEARHDLKFVIYSSLELLLLFIYKALKGEISLFFKTCIGGLCLFGAGSAVFFAIELRNKIKNRRFLMENGYDPKDEIQMEKLKSNRDKLHNEYIATDAYLNNLIEKEEDLQSMMDSNSLINGLEKYPEIVGECLNCEFKAYLDEIQKIRLEEIDLEPVVDEEELKINNIHQLKLK